MKSRDGDYYGQVKKGVEKMKALLIAEKPSLMKDIQSAYKQKGHPDTIDFTAFAGHTMTLKIPKEYDPNWERRSFENLPMIPKKFDYKVSDSKVTLYNKISSILLQGEYDYIINACDPGREGQLIFWSFYDSLPIKLPVKRIWHSDQTVESLSKALNNLRDEDEPELYNLTQSSKLRAVFDWLIGMNFSTGLSLASKNNVAVGRVMTPTLRLVVDRELEILNFKTDNYYTLECQYDGFTGTYFNKKIDSKFKDKAQVEAFVAQLGFEGVVRKIEKKVENKKAPGLMSLQVLQTEASKLFGYKMSETLEIAQSLYEKKYLSYPRTDSSHLTKAISEEFGQLLKTIRSSVSELVPFIEGIQQEPTRIEKAKKDKSYVNDAKVTDHYAIIPTKQVANLERLNEKERNIYTHVCKRFISIFMDSFQVEKTKMLAVVDGRHMFVTNGSVLIRKGYQELFNYKSKDQLLPPFTEGQVLAIKKYLPKAKSTKPPARYTDGTLGTAMENAGRFVEDEAMKKTLKSSSGIGRPATRGGIIDKLVNKGMMTYNKKQILPTEYGMSLIRGLNNHDVTNVELTAEWESKLQEVERGTLTPIDYYKQMVGYITVKSNEFKYMKLSLANNPANKSKFGGKKASSVVGKCPKCQCDVIDGKNYYLCENYKKTCNFLYKKELYGTKIPKTEMKKILKGQPSKAFQFSNNGKEWEATLMYNEDHKQIEFGKEEKRVKKEPLS